MARALVLSLALSSACAPPCASLCRKLLNDCELDTQRMSQIECETSCNEQEELYVLWEDEQKQALFDDHRRCLGSSTCEEIAEGVCYEGYKELFVF